MYSYNVETLRVIDGDTFVFNIDLGFGISKKITVRLAGYNAPELRHLYGHDIKDFVSKLLTSKNVPVKIKTFKTACYTPKLKVQAGPLI